MASRSNGHRGPMRLYASYMFRGKDPVIDELRTMTKDASPDGKLSRKVMRQIELEGGPTVSCQVAWYYGKTKRPNNCSTEAAGRSLGFKRRWVAM